MKRARVAEDRETERLLWALSAVTFLVFFQAFMIAPLIPRLAQLFSAPVSTVGLAVPAYLIPYGVATLIYGVFADRFGRERVMLGSLAALALLIPLSATARNPEQLIAWRVVSGLGASAIVPLSLSLIGVLYPFERRGRPLGWLFGAMAGGMAFGSTLGAILEPALGWRGVFLAVGALTLLPAIAVYRSRHLLRAGARTGGSFRELVSAYRLLLTSGQGFRTYAYVFVNAVFHSGTFTWLGLYFARRYGLGEIGIGLALLGYGIPGFFLGPAIGRAADRWGRRWLIPAGLAVAGIAALILAPEIPLLAAAVLVTALSLGYDMTQPLLAGIVTRLGGPRAGQAMGLNVFLLFIGFGLGSLVFGALVEVGFATAFLLFGSVQLLAALFAVGLFRDERVS